MFLKLTRFSSTVEPWHRKTRRFLIARFVFLLKILAFKFIDMVMGSTEYEENQMWLWRNQKPWIAYQKTTSSAKFAIAMFPDGIIDNIDQNHKNPESEDTKIRVVLEVQHLDRERKKSPLMLDSDGILLILQHEEHKQPTCFGAMEN